MSVNENLPEVDRRDRTAEEKRADLAALRADLGDTVETLAHRVDVPAQVRERRDVAVARARAAFDEKAPQVVRERPAWVAAAVVALLLLVVGARRASRRAS